MRSDAVLTWTLCMVSACASAPRPPAQPLPTVRHRPPSADYAGHLHLREAGDPSAPALLLVHGLGERASADFSPVIPALAQHYRVVALDLPGFGASPAAGHSFHPSDDAELVARVAAELAERQHRPIFLLGHSMGGVVAALVAGRHPELVDRLVLVDAAGILHREAYAASQFIDPLRGRRGTSVPVGLMHTMLAAGRAMEPDPEAIVASPRLRRVLLGDDPNKIAALSLIVTDVGPALSAIRAPTLLVWGARDRIAPLRNARVLQSRIAHARLVVLPEAGHVPMTDAPQRLVERIRAHLDDAPVPPQPARPSHGDFRCEDQDGAVLEGDYGHVRLERCEGVVLRDGTLESLTLVDSEATLENVRVHARQGPALRSENSVLRMDGGALVGEVAMQLDRSRLDLAGVTLTGRAHAILVDGAPTRALFSACVVQDAGVTIHAHGNVALARP